MSFSVTRLSKSASYLQQVVIIFSVSALQTRDRAVEGMLT